MTKRIGLITTLDTNIGDDFIRVGIQHVLNDVFEGQQLEYRAVNKHRPYTVYPKSNPLRWLPFERSALRQSVPSFGITLFDDCDLIVQCGAPVLWPNCHRCEWATPLWDQVVGRLRDRIPVLNLAAGACYPWERQPTTIESAADSAYLRRIHSYCRTTTVRDTLALSLYDLLGKQVRLIPCSALLAAGSEKAPAKAGSLILLNYMTGGGHYDWDQNIDAAQWARTMTDLTERLSKRHPVAFLCHNEREAQLARQLAPSVPRLLPSTTKEYMAVVSGAAAAVCNRLHASVALAGLGIPSVAVGNDTRLLMVAQLGLPIHYVKDVRAALLEDQIEGLLATRSSERERLLDLKDHTFKEYRNTIATVVTGHDSEMVQRTQV